MSEDLHKGATGNSFRYAIMNRQLQTEAENLLWQNLRSRKQRGVKFRRQHPVGSFILDFYSHECRLAIEVDGEYHNEQEQKEYDQGRTYELEENGIKVIRFTNQEIIEKLDWVLEEIKKYLNPNPSPGRRRE